MMIGSMVSIVISVLNLDVFFILMSEISVILNIKIIESKLGYCVKFLICILLIVEIVKFLMWLLNRVFKYELVVLVIEESFMLYFKIKF